MIQPDQKVIDQMARSMGMYPELVVWFNEWKNRELERLPFTQRDAVGIAQGRCQVLTELCKLVNTARDHAAQSRK